MAASLNRVSLIGNLGGDPDVRYMPDGTAVANLSVATTERWKDRNSGAQQERTDWHRTVLWGKLAEIAQQYLRKGSRVLLEGSLRTRKWTDDSGQDRYVTEVVLNGPQARMIMLDGARQASGSSPQQATTSAPQGGPSGGGARGVAGAPQAENFDDDIPF